LQSSYQTCVVNIAIDEHCSKHARTTPLSPQLFFHVHWCSVNLAPMLHLVCRVNACAAHLQWVLCCQTLSALSAPASQAAPSRPSDEHTPVPRATANPSFLCVVKLRESTVGQSANMLGGFGCSRRLDTHQGFVAVSAQAACSTVSSLHMLQG
jgi:hypothetical protein